MAGRGGRAAPGGRPAPHGEDGGQKKTGKVPLSSKNHHEGQHAEGTFATPPPMQVKYFHKFADTDAGEQSLHHTLGAGPGQSAPGDHRHDGGSSPFLLDQFTVAGVRGTSAYFQTIEAALAAVGANITATG